MIQEAAVLLEPETVEAITVSLTNKLTMFAIVIGPAIGVLLARYLDNKRVKDERRSWIFKTLMRTRRDPMTADHVGALNLIELEFSDCRSVIDAWRNLFSHFGTQHVKGPQETDEQFQRRLFQERQTLLAKLLHKMATELDFNIEQLEIFEGGYSPQGWSDRQALSDNLQLSMLDLLKGDIALPIRIKNEDVPDPDD